MFSTLGVEVNRVIHFTDRTPRQRAHETDTHPATVRTPTFRFWQQEMLRLLAEDVEVSVRARALLLPEAVRQELERRALLAAIGEAWPRASTDTSMHAQALSMVKLAAPAWEDESAIGVDVIVTRMARSRDGIRQRVFFSKAHGEDGAAPLWLANRKESELLAEPCKSGRYTPE